MSQNFITLITQQETPFGMHSNQDDNSNILNEPFAHIPLPAGIRCYSDASWKDNISGFGFSFIIIKIIWACLFKVSLTNLLLPFKLNLPVSYFGLPCSCKTSDAGPYPNFRQSKSNQGYTRLIFHAKATSLVLFQLKFLLQGQTIKFRWVPRKENKMADYLSKQASAFVANVQVHKICQNITHTCHPSTSCPTMEMLFSNPFGDASSLIKLLSSKKKTRSPHAR